jgi:hypothetical protein
MGDASAILVNTKVFTFMCSWMLCEKVTMFGLGITYHRGSKWASG